MEYRLQSVHVQLDDFVSWDDGFATMGIMTDAGIYKRVNRNVEYVDDNLEHSKWNWQTQRMLINFF